MILRSYHTSIVFSILFSCTVFLLAEKKIQGEMSGSLGNTQAAAGSAGAASICAICKMEGADAAIKPCHCERYVHVGRDFSG